MHIQTGRTTRFFLSPTSLPTPHFPSPPSFHNGKREEGKRIEGGGGIIIVMTQKKIQVWSDHVNQVLRGQRNITIGPPPDLKVMHTDRFLKNYEEEKLPDFISSCYVCLTNLDMAWEPSSSVVGVLQKSSLKIRDQVLDSFTFITFYFVRPEISPHSSSSPSPHFSSFSSPTSPVSLALAGHFHFPHYAMNSSESLLSISCPRVSSDFSRRTDTGEWGGWEGFFATTSSLNVLFIPANTRHVAHVLRFPSSYFENHLQGGEFHVRGMSLQVEPLYPNKSKKPTTNNTTPTQNNINALNMNRNLNINNSHSSIHLNNNITVKNTSNPIAPPPPNKSSFLVLWLFFVSKEGRAVAAQTPINPLKWPLNDSSVSNQQQPPILFPFVNNKKYTCLSANIFSRMVAVGAQDGTLSIFSLPVDNNERELTPLREISLQPWDIRAGGVTSCSWSPDGMTIGIEWGGKKEGEEKEEQREGHDENEGEKGCMCVFSSVGCRILMMEKREKEEEMEEGKGAEGGKGKEGEGKKRVASREVFFWSEDGCDLLYLSGGMELLRVGLGVGSWGRCMSGRKSTSPLFVCHSSILRMASPNAASWNQSEKIVSDLWEMIPFPSDYFQLAFPLNKVCGSPCGRWIAVAGKTGFVVYSFSFKRWKYYKDDTPDNQGSIEVIDMCWSGSFLIVLAQTVLQECVVLFFNTLEPFHWSAVHYQFPFLQKTLRRKLPSSIDCSSNNLIIYTPHPPSLHHYEIKFTPHKAKRGGCACVDQSLSGSASLQTVVGVCHTCLRRLLMSNISFETIKNTHNPVEVVGDEGGEVVEMKLLNHLVLDCVGGEGGGEEGRGGGAGVSLSLLPEGFQMGGVVWEDRKKKKKNDEYSPTSSHNGSNNVNNDTKKLTVNRHAQNFSLPVVSSSSDPLPSPYFYPSSFSSSVPTPPPSHVCLLLAPGGELFHILLTSGNSTLLATNISEFSFSSSTTSSDIILADVRKPHHFTHHHPRHGEEYRQRGEEGVGRMGGSGGGGSGIGGEEKVSWYLKMFGIRKKTRVLTADPSITYYCRSYVDRVVSLFGSDGFHLFSPYPSQYSVPPSSSLSNVLDLSGSGGHSHQNGHDDKDEDEDEDRAPMVRQLLKPVNVFEFDPEVFPIWSCVDSGVVFCGTSAHSKPFHPQSTPPVVVRQHPLIHSLLTHTLRMDSLSLSPFFLPHPLPNRRNKFFCSLAINDPINKSAKVRDELPLSFILAERYTNTQMFWHSCEVLLAKAVEKGYTEWKKERRVDGEGVREIKKVLLLLRGFCRYGEGAVFVRIIAAVARKSDPQVWPLLFSLIGSPLSLFKNSLCLGPSSPSHSPSASSPTSPIFPSFSNSPPLSFAANVVYPSSSSAPSVNASPPPGLKGKGQSEKGEKVAGEQAPPGLGRTEPPGLRRGRRNRTPPGLRVGADGNGQSLRESWRKVEFDSQLFVGVGVDIEAAAALVPILADECTPEVFLESTGALLQFAVHFDSFSLVETVLNYLVMTEEDLYHPQLSYHDPPHPSTPPSQRVIHAHDDLVWQYAKKLLKERKVEQVLLLSHFLAQPLHTYLLSLSSPSLPLLFSSPLLFDFERGLLELLDDCLPFCFSLETGEREDVRGILGELREKDGGRVEEKRDEEEKKEQRWCWKQKLDEKFRESEKELLQKGRAFDHLRMLSEHLSSSLPPPSPPSNSTSFLWEFFIEVGEGKCEGWELVSCVGLCHLPLLSVVLEKYSKKKKVFLRFMAAVRNLSRMSRRKRVVSYCRAILSCFQS